MHEVVDDRLPGDRVIRSPKTAACRLRYAGVCTCSTRQALIASCSQSSPLTRLSQYDSPMPVITAPFLSKRLRSFQEARHVVDGGAAFRWLLTPTVRAPADSAAPKIYVYELPERFNLGLVDMLEHVGDPLSATPPAFKCAQSRCRCGQGVPSPGADVARCEPSSRCRCRCAYGTRTPHRVRAARR